MTWPGSGETRNLIPLTILAFVIATTTTLMTINGYWFFLVGAVGVIGALWFFALKSTTRLLIVFAFLPFQSLLNDVFAGRIPMIAIAKDLLMVGVILSLLANQMIRRRSWCINTVITLLLVFAVLCTMYALGSPYPLKGILALRFLALYPLLVLIVANTLETREEINRLLRLIALVGVVTVVYGLLQYATLFDVPYRTSGGDVTLRMGRFGEMGMVSTFASRPTCGAYMVVLFLLFLQDKLWEQSKFKQWLRWPMLAAIGACVLLTFSRSSWLALLVGTFVVLYFRDKMRAILAAVGLVICAILFSVVQALSPAASIADAATDNESFLIRLNYWPMVARHVLENPFGIGLGTVGGPHLFEADAQADDYGNLRYDQNTYFDPNADLSSGGTLAVTDNTFLKLFLQGGFPMLITFLSFVGAALHLANRLLKSLRDPEQDPWARDVTIWATASFVSLLTVFMFVDFLESAPAISLHWMAVGLLCCVKKFRSAPPVVTSG